MNPLVELYMSLAQDSLAGEDGFDDLRSGQSQPMPMAPPMPAPPAPGLMDLWDKYGKAAREGLGLPHWTELGRSSGPHTPPERREQSPEDREARRARAMQPQLPNVPVARPSPDLAFPQASSQLPAPQGALPRSSLESIPTHFLEQPPAPRPQGIGGVAPTPPVASPGGPDPTALIRLLQGGAPDTSGVDRIIQSMMGGGGRTGGGGGDDFSRRMRGEVENLRGKLTPIPEPTQAPFDRSIIDKYMELAKPKEPVKRNWQDQLIDFGLGMTMGAARGGKGWGILNPMLAGGAQSWGAGRDDDRAQARKYDEEMRRYYLGRAGAEGDMERFRVQRADDLTRLKLDVERANRGDLFAMARVSMEADKAIGEAQRGNASLANQKLGILMNAELAKTRIGMAQQANNIRLLGVMTRNSGPGRGPTVDIAGSKLPLANLTPAQASIFMIPKLIKNNQLQQFMPPATYDRLDAQAKAGATAAGRKIGAPPGTPQWQKEYETQFQRALSAWFTSADTDAETARGRLYGVLQNSVPLAALAGSRENLRSGLGFDPFDDED